MRVFMRFLLILIIINISIVNETVAQVPTISNISLGPPILCNGDFTNILVDVNQTIPATAYTCVTGYYSGTYFISFATTNTTTSNSFSIPLSAGDYVVRIVDSIAYYNGNGSSWSGVSTAGIYFEWGSIISIPEPLPLTVLSNSVSSNICNGNSIAQEEVVISGGTGPYSIFYNSSNINLSNGTSAYIFSGLSSGIYNLDVTDVNGCASIPSTFSINIPIIPPINTNGSITSNYSGYQVSANGANDGGILAFSSGGTGSFTYSIDGINFQTSPQFNGLAAGTYTLTYLDANNCSSSEIFILNAPPPVLIPNIDNVTVAGPILCNGDFTDIVIDVNQTTPLTSFICEVGYYAGSTFIPFASTMVTTSVNFPVQVIAGNYAVRLIDPLTNVIFDEWVNIISIIEPPLLIASSNSITSNLCTGDSNASEQLVISGGVQPYALVLNSSSADFSPTVNVSLSNTLCNTLADLSIIVSQDPGEVDMLTALFESNVGQFDIASMTVGDIIGTANMLAAGGSFNITANLIVSSITPNSEAIIQVTSPNSILGNFTIINNFPGISISTQSVADGNSFTSGNVSNITFNNVFINGCSTILFTSTISSELGDTEICLPIGETTYTFNNLSSGTYNVYISDANNCSTFPSPFSFVIPAINPINTNGNVTSNYSGFGISCNGASDGEILASASGGTGSFTYSLNGVVFQSNPLFTGLSAGTYTITYKDANNCIETEQVTINEPPSLLGNIQVSNTISCFGDNNGELSFFVDPIQNGVPGYQYSINGGPYQSSSIFTGLSANILYNVEVIDNNSCSYITSISLTEPSPLIVSTAITDASCFNENDAGVTFNISGGTPPYNLDFNGTIYSFSGSTFSIPNTLTAGTYNYTINDDNSCFLGYFVLISEPPLISYTDVVDTCSSFTWINGVTYSSTDTASTILTSSNGCDSIIYLDLNISSSIINLIDTACGEFLFNNNILDSSGIYIDTLLSTYGCDSIVNLALTIYEDSSVTYITACDSAEWNGVWYYNDTTVIDTGFYTTTAFGGSTSSSGSGNEGNFWYFGQNSGLDFNTGSPVAINDGQLNTLEGCATISDNNGNLLFYTDGSVVYNSLHSIMQNGTGLLGSPSSTQSAIIVKKPGSNTLYYIFTVDGFTGTGGGLNYSIVDMSLDGGLGAINSNKNISLINSTCEKVTAIIHNNGTDFWIISREENSDVFLSFLLTSSGLNLIPVYSNAFSFLNNTGGYLKGSPDGSKIAACYFTILAPVEVYDFDNQTGILSNPITGTPGYFYGLEFSPNNQILYASEYNSKQIHQYDLNLLPLSHTIIGTTATQSGALQLAPDNNIYVLSYSLTTLDVISDPNILGLSCNYINDAINIFGSTGLGLPTFFSSIFNTQPFGCDSVATAIIDIKNSSSTYTQVVQCDSFTWALNGQTYFASMVDTIQSINSDGCQHIDSLELIIQPEIIINPILSDELCINYNDGSITLNTSGGIGPFNFSWTGPNGFNSNNEDIFNLSPGTYVLNITDITSSCTKDTSFIISPGFELQLTTSSTNISCYNFSDGEIDINPINLISPVYSWSDISTSFEDRIGLSPSTYYLQIDDSNCFYRDTFVITQPDSLFILSTQTNSTCSSDSLGFISVQVFGGTQGYSYYWSNWTNVSLNDSLAPGIYELDVIDSNGCIIEETFTISPYSLDVNSIINNVACYGDSSASIDLSISGGFPIYTYNWSNGINTEDVYNLSEGTISCVISDYFGCDTTITFNITELPEIIVSSNITDASCYGANDGSAILNIIGGAPPMNINWYNIDENNLSSGTYAFQITDNNGCFYNDSIYVNQPDSIILQISTIDLQCNSNPTGVININSISGGTSPYNLLWSGPNSFSSNLNNINNLYAGIYTLSVSDGNNCSVNNQIIISEPIAVSQFIDIEISNYSTYSISCDLGSDGWINVTPSGGYLPYTFSWNSMNGFSSTDQNISNLYEGDYNLIVTNGLGCNEEFVFSLNSPDALGGTLTSLYDYNGYDIRCFGLNDGGILVNEVGGVPPYSYYWNGNQGLNPIAFQQAGLYDLVLYDNNGCRWQESIILEQPDSIKWTRQIFTDTCDQGVGEIIINVIGGVAPYQYLWNDGQNTNTANNLFEGEYSLILRDDNSCQRFDTIIVDNLIKPDLDFNIFTDYEKLSQQLEDPIVFIDMTETFWQNTLEWQWNFGDGTIAFDSIAMHSYQDTGTFNVLLTITTDYNCIDTLIKQVRIDEYELFIPSAFTPNSLNDNINNIFTPYGIGVSEFTMQIFSRWGGLIYETNNLLNGWNGKFNNNGKDIQSGVYVYYVKVKDVFGRIHKYEGQVNLIR
tara:strand:- start:4554 stop:11519 length:6966 start_codon:yes stop_codon:yes gene_type:complete